MRLIGMLDSPYVRRTAISMHLMDLPFAHESISVFRQVDAFAAINPVVKAPTLVTDDGTVLMESGLILEYLDRFAAPERRLNPSSPGDHARAQRLIGLALAVCEKAIQIVYEFELRPADKRHQPWLDRVTGQLQTACSLLDREVDAGDGWLFGDRPLQADVSAAVAWRFTQLMVADRVPADRHPALLALSARAEALPAFRAAPPV